MHSGCAATWPPCFVIAIMCSLLMRMVQHALSNSYGLCTFMSSQNVMLVSSCWQCFIPPIYLVRL